jgi:CRISPR-associated protein Cas2
MTNQAPKATASQERHKRVFAYDVVDDKKRNRVAKVLEGVGERLQYSVFVAHLDDEGVRVTLARLEKRIDRTTDRIHVFTLCACCADKTRTAGVDLPVAPGFDVV